MMFSGYGTAATQVGDVMVGPHLMPFSGVKGVAWPGDVNTYVQNLMMAGCDMRLAKYVQYTGSDGVAYVYGGNASEGGSDYGRTENPLTWKLSSGGLFNYQAVKVGNTAVGAHFQPFTAGKVAWTGDPNTYLRACQASGCDLRQAGHIQFSGGLPYIYKHHSSAGGPGPDAGNTDNPETWAVRCSGYIHCYPVKVGNVSVGDHYHPFTAGKVPWGGSAFQYLQNLQAAGCDMSNVGHCQLSPGDGLPYVYKKTGSIGNTDNPETYRVDSYSYGYK